MKKRDLIWRDKTALWRHGISIVPFDLCTVTIKMPTTDTWADMLPKPLHSVYVHVSSSPKSNSVACSVLGHWRGPGLTDWDHLHRKNVLGGEMLWFIHLYVVVMMVIISLRWHIYFVLESESVLADNSIQKGALLHIDDEQQREGDRSRWNMPSQGTSHSGPYWVIFQSRLSAGCRWAASCAESTSEWVAPLWTWLCCTGTATGSGVPQLHIQTEARL